MDTPEQDNMPDLPPSDAMDQRPTESQEQGFAHEDGPETFLDSDCGKTGCSLVARGSAILAEIFRLSNHIPDVFLFNKVATTKGKQTQFTYISAEGKSLTPEEVRIRFFEHEKYLQILFSYDYIQNKEAYDEKIKSNMEVYDMDQGFQDSYMEIIDRFYNLFESIYVFWVDTNQYISDIMDGRHIDYTMEAMLLDKEGKRLIIETVYHYGVMLLLLDRLIPSIARERIVTCYVRYKDTALTERTQKVAKLCKSTGYLYNRSTNTEEIPDKYPCDYYNRFKLRPQLIETLINAMKDDDIYDMIGVFGNKPQYRSVALSMQAQMIFVLVPFCPQMLEHQSSKMREICDKHFSDNWVIPIYNGVLVDIISYWSTFTAANKALTNNITETSVQQYAKFFTNMVRRSIDRISNYLVEGQLQEAEALHNVKELLGCLRDANHTMRWIMLHQHTRQKGLKQIVGQIINTKELIDLLLDLAKFEHLLKDRLTEIVHRKSKVWKEDKKRIEYCLFEVSEFFAGNRDWAGKQDQPDMAEYFKKFLGAIEKFEYKRQNMTKIGRTIDKMIKALNEIELEQDIFDENAQLKSFISDTQNRLIHMVRIMQIKKEIVQNLYTIVDFSYAWEVINDYLGQLQATISENPRAVLLLKTVFLKLATIMERPLQRIIQIQSNDQLSVAKYYSGQLFEFVKSVLNIIPRNIFKQLDEISNLLQVKVTEFEVRISKQVLKEGASFQDRFLLAKKTHEITMFTEGMLVLDNTLMGVIEIEPKAILVDGLRTELCKKLAQMLHRGFIFDYKLLALIQQGKPLPEGVHVGGDFGLLESKFKAVKQHFVGMFRSIEYISDFLNVPGQKIWREELTRIINLAVEKEASRLVNKKYSGNIDTTQDNQYVPEFTALDEHDFTFMGRLLRFVLQSISNGFYLEATQTWYDQQGNQVFGVRFIHFLQENLGTSFLQGFDKLLVYNIVHELRLFYKEYGACIGGGSVSLEMQKRIKKSKDMTTLTQALQNLEKTLGTNFESLSPQLLKNYQTMTKYVAPSIQQAFLPRLDKIGKLQLLRKITTSQIHFISRVESAHYTNCLKTFNTSMLHNLDEIRTNAIATYIEEAEDAQIDIEQPKSGNMTMTRMNQTAMQQQQATQKVRIEAEKKAQDSLKSTLKELTKTVEHIGLVNPMQKVYELTNKLDHMSEFFAILTIQAMQVHLVHSKNLNSLVRKSKESLPIDGPHFIVGLLTVFKQFHPSNYKRYLLILSHYYKNVIFATTQEKVPIRGLPEESNSILTYLDELMKFETSPREIISQNLGTFVFDSYRQ